MTHRVRSAFGRFFPSGVALLLVASSLAAQQTTGKIEGTVTDPAGVPIASAQVLMVGTAVGSFTDQKGYYFINNVPVGTYTLRSQFIGYAASEIRGVRVQGGQTMTVNITMQPAAVAVAGVVVTAERNPIVPRDQVTSKTILPAETVTRLPIDDIRQVLTLVPGVVESQSGLGVSVRGGRPGQTAIYIDGAPAAGLGGGFNPAGGTRTQIIQVNRNAVEEASVTTGALGVDFGDAQAGVIAFTTKSGSQKFQGSASYETDEPFGNAISVGFNRFEGSLGGPVPSIANLRWFASGVLQGQVSSFGDASLGTIGAATGGVGQDAVPTYVMGGIDTTVFVTKSDGSVQAVAIPQFVQYGGQCQSASNYGFDCQGRRFPFNWRTLLQGQGKLAYSYGSGSNISVTGLYNGDQHRAFPGDRIGDPSLYRGSRRWSRLGVLNWNHTVFKSADRQLALNVNVSAAQDRRIDGLLDPTFEVANRSPRMGIDFHTMEFSNFTGFPFPITDDIITNLRTNQGLRAPLLGRTDLRNSAPYRMNPYGILHSSGASNAWFTVGSDGGGLQLHENRYRAFAQVDWQANRFHRFNFGGEARKSNIAYWQSDARTVTALEFLNAYVASPLVYGVWAADRLDLGDVVLELGARYDILNSRALFPRYPGYTFSDSLWSPLAATNAASLDSSLARVFVPAEMHKTLSPRLRVSFPITEKTDFRLSYAHQVQTPDFNTLLSGSNGDLTFTNTNDAFGRDVTFGKTILFEFGVRHAFNPDLVVDVSAYNKDFVSELTYRIKPFPAPTSAGGVYNANVLTNGDFGYARGIDVRVDRRIGTWLNSSVSYTFQVARSTGSDPFSYLNTSARATVQITGDRVPPPEQPLPTDDNRTHNIVAAVTLTTPADWQRGTTLGTVLRDVGVFATFRAVSGLPYTRLANVGLGITAPRTRYGLSANALEPINTSTMPWTKFLDVRVNKGFRFGRTDWTLFADVRNVLNFKNATLIYVETGDVVNEEFHKIALEDELALLENEALTNGKLLPGGSIDLRPSCSGWSGDAGPVDCVLLRRTEARFGDADGVYTLAEQTKAIDASYNQFNGPQSLYGPPRHIRVGLELSF